MDVGYRRASFNSLPSCYTASINGDRYFPSSGFYSSDDLRRKDISFLPNYRPKDAVFHHFAADPSRLRRVHPVSTHGKNYKRKISDLWFGMQQIAGVKHGIIRCNDVRSKQGSKHSESQWVKSFSCFSLAEQGLHYPTRLNPYPGNGKTVWTVLGTFATVTSLQGVPYMKKANRWWSTLFWVIIFIIACVACILHIWYLTKEYISYDTSTKTTIGYDYLDFPSVTVCNMNPIRLNQLDKTPADLQAFIQEIAESKNGADETRQKVSCIHWFLFLEKDFQSLTADDFSISQSLMKHAKVRLQEWTSLL